MNCRQNTKDSRQRTNRDAVNEKIRSKLTSTIRGCRKHLEAVVNTGRNHEPSSASIHPIANGNRTGRPLLSSQTALGHLSQPHCGFAHVSVQLSRWVVE